MKIVAFEKTSENDRGLLPKGHVFTYSYKSLPQREAIVRAKKMFEFQYKDENILNWRLIET